MEWESGTDNGRSSVHGETLDRGEAQHEELVARVQKRAGLSTSTDARAVVATVLLGLGRGLLDDDRRALLLQLPETFGDALDVSHSQGRLESLSEITRDMTSELGVDESTAHELTLAVCQETSRALKPHQLTLLRSRLPRELADALDFVPEETEVTDSPSNFAPRPEEPEERTLAGGRPGAERPLSEAAPGQRESIAITPRPRHDRKLATGDGTATSGDSLSEGQPGSKRPLSES